MRRPLLPVLAAGLAILFMTAGAMRAQEEGGKGRRGGGGFGQGGFGGGFGRIDKSMLLGSEQVRKEIKLNEEQSKKVEEILASHREAQMELFQGARGNRDASDEERAKAREERTAKTAELGKKTEAKLAEVLDKKQTERLDQIVIQQQGPDALVSDKVIAAISLKPEQVEKIKATLAKRDEEVRSSFGGGRRGGDGGGQGGGNREEARAKLEKARKDAETAAFAVLSKEQSESFTKLKGENFELDRSTLRGPGGGGRGGFGPGGPGSGNRGGAEGGGNQKKRPPADDEA
jgi:Spy/CpxP family protein refolding chaperone